MVNSTIENFLEIGKRQDKIVRIDFKKRSSIQGLFIRLKDYPEMKKKNFWRIVTASNESEWRKTKDLSCSRIFCGDEFTRLSEV